MKKLKIYNFANKWETKRKIWDPNPKDGGVKSCLLTWNKFIGLVSGNCLIE